jgi:hypothetical protein
MATPEAIAVYLKQKRFPPNVSRGLKSNIITVSKKYVLENEKLCYKHRRYGNLPVITDPVEQASIVRAVHYGIGNNNCARAMAGHYGRD